MQAIRPSGVPTPKPTFSSELDELDGLASVEDEECVAKLVGVVEAIDGIDLEIDGIPTVV